MISVVTVKMKQTLRVWLSGTKSSDPSQVHLRVDTPCMVISQKRMKQQRHDKFRGAIPLSGNNESREALTKRPDFNEEIVIPWTTLLSNRSYKDELAWLQLLCSALSAEELTT